MTERKICLWLGILALAIIVSSSAVLADILITKSGSRYEGEIIESSESYVLIKPSGGKMTLPKSMVKEIITADAAKAQYTKMLAAADLTNDTQVDKLLAFTIKCGLATERKKLLEKAYAGRFAKAKDKMAALRALVGWCRKYGMETEADLCEQQAARLQFPAKRTATGKAPIDLAKLANWCRKHGLNTEAEEIEAKALKMAPNDPKVQKELGIDLEKLLLTGTAWRDSIKVALGCSVSTSAGPVKRSTGTVMGFSIDNRSPCGITVIAPAGYVPGGVRRVRYRTTAKDKYGKWKIHPYSKLVLAVAPSVRLRSLPVTPGKGARSLGAASVLKTSVCYLVLSPTRTKLKPVELEMWVTMLFARGKLFSADYTIVPEGHYER